MFVLLAYIFNLDFNVSGDSKTLTKLQAVKNQNNFLPDNFNYTEFKKELLNKNIEVLNLYYNRLLWIILMNY